jgi:hypothetical protein
VLAAVLFPTTVSAASWSSSVPFTNQVASSPFEAGGYPVPPGQTVPDPGTCRLGDYNANRSESWVAVNHIPGNRYQDHVYAAWAVFNGSATKVRIAISRDRGQTFSKAVTLSAPAQVGPAVTYVCLAAACPIRPSATGSPSTSRPARPTRATCT